MSSCISNFVRKSDTYNTFNEASFSDNIIYNDIVFTDNNYALLIPVFFENYPDTVFFQLDVGTSQTVLYENALSVLNLNTDKVRKVKGVSYYLKPTLKLNQQDYIVADSLIIIPSSKSTEELAKGSQDKTKRERLILGTLGYDFIYPRAIILDFQNKKYRLTETVDYNHFHDFYFLKGVSCDKSLMTLKIKIGKKKMKVIYDSGSGACGVVVLEKKWDKFDGEIKDTIRNLSSWGKETILYSKEISDNLIIGQDTISNVKLYKSNIEENYKLGFYILGVKGIIGNSLFFNKSIIVDTKNNKFGIKASR